MKPIEEMTEEELLAEIEARLERIDKFYKNRDNYVFMEEIASGKRGPMGYLEWCKKNGFWTQAKEDEMWAANVYWRAFAAHFMEEHKKRTAIS